jgi:hypothetical protein
VDDRTAVSANERDVCMPIVTHAEFCQSLLQVRPVAAFCPDTRGSTPQSAAGTVHGDDAVSKDKDDDVTIGCRSGTHFMQISKEATSNKFHSQSDIIIFS